MNFDRLGEQHVMKRRRPSPIRKTRRSPSFSETFLSQEVWPRHRRRETDFGFGKIRQLIFDRVAPGNIERPKRRKSAANTTARATTSNATTNTEAVNGGADAHEATQDRLSRGLFSLRVPSAWVKTLAIALGILVLGIIGINWDGISGVFTAQPNISPHSLEDPVSPLNQRTPDFSPLQWNDSLYSTEIPLLLYTDIPLNLTETFSWSLHVVTPGETISGIAVRHSVSQESIIALNNIRESWNLQTGRTLRIPNMNGIPYTVRENDTLDAIARNMGIPLNVLLDANDIYNDNIVPGQVLFIPGGRMDATELRRAIWRTPDRPMVRPVGGRITSGFGWREDPFNPGSGNMQLHRAVDLAGRIGDPVRAAMGGTVLHRGANLTYGNFIVLQHGDYQTLYAHLSAFSVTTGETVRQGQEIGRVGNTGRTTGPHLHFAVFYRGEPINPIDRWR